MKWIEGPTLDLYIGEMLHRPDVLLHLSEEWLRLLNALRVPELRTAICSTATSSSSTGSCVWSITTGSLCRRWKDGPPARSVINTTNTREETLQHFDEKLG